MAAAFVPATNVITFATTGDAITLQNKMRTCLIMWDSFTAAAGTFSITETDSGAVLVQAQAGATSGTHKFYVRKWVTKLTFTASAGRAMIVLEDE